MWRVLPGVWRHESGPAPCPSHARPHERVQGWGRRAFRIPDLKRGSAAFPVADADGFIDCRDEDFAVPNLPRSGCGDDDLHGLFQQFVRDHGFDLDFWQKVHRIFASPVKLRMALLAAVTACLKDRHALDTDGQESIFDCVKLRRLNDSFYLLHSLFYRVARV